MVVLSPKTQLLSGMMVLIALSSFAAAPPQQTKAASIISSPVVVAPACPIISVASAQTKTLSISYYPSNAKAVIKNPGSLTLRLVFNGPSWRDNDRSLPFQHQKDGSWLAAVPLSPSLDYAIWYVRDDNTGKRDDNNGQYWDLVFCDANGKQLTEGVRDQAEGYAGSIFSDDIKRAADYDRAIYVIEAGNLGGRLVFDEWYFKFRRQSKAKLASPALVHEIESELTQHAKDQIYLRETAQFLINFESAFPPRLVEHSVELADRISPHPTMELELDRERAERQKEPRERVKLLGEWLAKYPHAPAYSEEILKQRMDAFDELGDIGAAEACFRDLAKRTPHDSDVYATMAAIYVRHHTDLNQALALLDKAEKELGPDGAIDEGFFVILGRDAKQDKATLDLWRGRAFSEKRQWKEAEAFLQKAAPLLDQPEAYSLLAHAQEQRQELTNAKASYLEAAARQSGKQQDYIEQFVRLSLATGTPGREAAMKELAGARRKNFDAAHYKPGMVDLPVPGFSFTTSTQKQITASSLRGKTVVVDLWATWCGPCVSELGGFEKFRLQHPEITLLLVAINSTTSEIEKRFRAAGISTEEIVSADDANAAKFGANGVPQTYVIDKNGRIRFVHYGAIPDVVSYLNSDLALLNTSSAAH